MIRSRPTSELGQVTITTKKVRSVILAMTNQYSHISSVSGPLIKIFIADTRVNLKILLVFGSPSSLTCLYPF